MAGLQIYNMASNGAMSFVTSISDTPKTYLTEISDLASFGSGGDRVLLALSSVDHGMTSFRISSTGASEVVDSIGPREGLYISGAQMLQVAQVAGQNFAVLAASGSDSLSVVRINPMGVFFVTDHMIDDRQTRFANVSALDMFEANGRMFVVAAGNDSGFSILELLPGGILSQFQTHVRETGTSLGAVTAIEAKVIGASVFVFMTQSDGTQVQQFELTLANLGLAITAQAGGTTLGTALNDRLFGSALGDTLQGAGGADWLHDGLGVDQLSGGGGADVFVFASDGALDRITDFEMGIDRLDMSAWGRIYSASAFDIQSTLNGAEISFGQERVILISANGQSLNPLSFTDADFLF
jgi:serralysin